MLTPKACADMIKQSEYTVAFTGAGVSTDAGIPDFRGPEGLYTTRHYDPDKVFDINYFHEHPEMFYRFTKDYIAMAKDIQPTFTHLFLSRLEEKGMLKGVITQNIDALHHKAGSKNIAELHGTYWSACCTHCHNYTVDHIDLKWWEKVIDESPRSPVPVCPKCEGTIKPDVVFFGEPVRDLHKAETMALEAELMLVLGSSLTVYPAAMLPQITQGKVIVINKGNVRMALSKNRYFVDEDLNKYLKEVAENLKL